MALIHLPLRIGDFATLTLGKTLIARGEAYAIRIEPETTKGGRAIEAMLPRPACEALRLYIDRHRPALADPSASGQRAWLTETGRPYRPYVFSERIAWLAKSRFGVRVSAHRFRACAATLIAELAPEQAGIIRPLLAHATTRVADRHYNQARMRAVVTAHAEHLRRLVKDPQCGERAAEASFSRLRTVRIASPRSKNCRLRSARHRTTGSASRGSSVRYAIPVG